MVQGDIKEFGTEGEKAFYKFLEGWPSRMHTTSAGDLDQDRFSYSL
jgi:hypothetical protein